MQYLLKRAAEKKKKKKKKKKNNFCLLANEMFYTFVSQRYSKDIYKTTLIQVMLRKHIVSSKKKSFDSTMNNTF